MESLTFFFFLRDNFRVFIIAKYITTFNLSNNFVFVEGIFDAHKHVKQCQQAVKKHILKSSVVD